MLYKTTSGRARNSGAARFRPQPIPNHLALALIGQTVSVLSRSKTVMHGIVAGVTTQTGRPKLVVGRAEYDLNQVLSVTPPAFN
jgi:hypothetical protein